MGSRRHPRFTRPRPVLAGVASAALVTLAALVASAATFAGCGGGDSLGPGTRDAQVGGGNAGDDGGGGGVSLTDGSADAFVADGPHYDHSLVVPTSLGPVQGALDLGVPSFRGIPYAAPPVGALRWSAPIPPTEWTSPLDATSFTSSCIQLDTDGDLLPGGSEDCLTLNIWTPAGELDAGSKLPVLAFIHGGYFVKGGATYTSTTSWCTTAPRSQPSPTPWSSPCSTGSGPSASSLIRRSPPSRLPRQLRAARPDRRARFRPRQHRPLRWGQHQRHHLRTILGRQLRRRAPRLSARRGALLAGDHRERWVQRLLGGHRHQRRDHRGQHARLRHRRRRRRLSPREGRERRGRRAPRLGARPRSLALPRRRLLAARRPAQPHHRRRVEQGAGPPRHQPRRAVGHGLRLPARRQPADTDTRRPTRATSARSTRRTRARSWRPIRTPRTRASPVSGLAQLLADDQYTCPTRQAARALAASGEPVFRYLFVHSLDPDDYTDGGGGNSVLGAYHFLEVPFVFHAMAPTDFASSADEYGLSSQMIDLWGSFAPQRCARRAGRDLAAVPGDDAGHDRRGR